jgi:hypothetical protein
MTYRPGKKEEKYLGLDKFIKGQLSMFDSTKTDTLEDSFHVVGSDLEKDVLDWLDDPESIKTKDYRDFHLPNAIEPVLYKALEADREKGTIDNNWDDTDIVWWYEFIVDTFKKASL